MRVVLGIQDDLGLPRSFRDVQREIGIRGLNRSERELEPRLLAQLSRGGDSGLLSGLPGAGRRRPRPVTGELGPKWARWRTRNSRAASPSRHTTTHDANGRSRATGSPSQVRSIATT
jgi:hypothetical protein